MICISVYAALRKFASWVQHSLGFPMEPAIEIIDSYAFLVFWARPNVCDPIKDLAPLALVPTDSCFIFYWKNVSQAIIHHGLSTTVICLQPLIQWVCPPILYTASCIFDHHSCLHSLEIFEVPYNFTPGTVKERSYRNPYMVNQSDISFETLPGSGCTNSLKKEKFPAMMKFTVLVCFIVIKSGQSMAISISSEISYRFHAIAFLLVALLVTRVVNRCFDTLIDSNFKSWFSFPSRS